MTISTIEHTVYETDDPGSTGGTGRAGSAGGTVLSIHGLERSFSTWTPMMPAAQRHQVIRIDPKHITPVERPSCVELLPRFQSRRAA